MLPVHILGELAKPVSLSCRLFGNIFGEDTLIVVFVSATALLLKGVPVAARGTAHGGHSRALHDAPDADEHRAGADFSPPRDRCTST